MDPAIEAKHEASPNPPWLSDSRQRNEPERLRDERLDCCARSAMRRESRRLVRKPPSCHQALQVRIDGRHDRRAVKDTSCYPMVSRVCCPIGHTNGRQAEDNQVACAVPISLGKIIAVAAKRRRSELIRPSSTNSKEIGTSTGTPGRGSRARAVINDAIGIRSSTFPSSWAATTGVNVTGPTLKFSNSACDSAAPRISTRIYGSPQRETCGDKGGPRLVRQQQAHI